MNCPECGQVECMGSVCDQCEYLIFPKRMTTEQKVYNVLDAWLYGKAVFRRHETGEMLDCRKVGLNLIRLCTQPDEYVYCTCSDRDRRREFGVDCPIHSYKTTA